VAEPRYECASCGKPKTSDHRYCRDCYLAGFFQTPLRRWRRRTGRSFADLARCAGVHRITVHRAAAGKPMSGRVARAIARETGIPIEEIIDGEPGAIG
jgi:transcriptional regulator with XRE-family HTH domain